MAKSPEEIREYKRKWYEKNKVKFLAQCKIWRENNKERKKANNRAWYERNREKVREQSEAWRKAHPEKAKAWVAAWQAKNQDKIKAAGKEWRKKNRKRVNASAVKYARNNKDKVKAAFKVWYYKNPEKAREIRLRRRLRSKNAEGRATAAEIRDRMKQLGNKCVYCGGPFEHVDHFIPLANGGTGWPSNLVPACAQCNFSKNSKLPSEWTVETLGQGILVL